MKDARDAEIRRLEGELSRYKDAVKQLAFDLEMASTFGSPYVHIKESEVKGEVRRVALDQAAEHLMDHGVIRTGKELEAVCNEIKSLSTVKAVLIVKPAKKGTGHLHKDGSPIWDDPRFCSFDPGSK